MPGHCPGQVCLRLGDVLLAADHVLSRITPHQAPESITLNMGLGHYFTSLDKVAKLDGMRLALGGHENPIEDLPKRVGQIRAAHERRLERVLELCAEPAVDRRGVEGSVRRASTATTCCSRSRRPARTSSTSTRPVTWWPGTSASCGIRKSRCIEYVRA